jgi:hypothetical protein
MATQLSLFEAPPGPDEEPAPPSPTAGDARLVALRAEIDARDALKRRLAAALDRPIESLVLTRNRTRIVSANVGRGGLRLRLHESFLAAGDAVVAAIGEFLSPRSAAHRKLALATIRAHFVARTERHPRPQRQPRLRARGHCFDLEALRDRFNRDYFGGALLVAITWGRGAAGPRGAEPAGHETVASRWLEALGLGRRPKSAPAAAPENGSFHIRLGSYHERDNLVRIHPVLDRPEVPEFVVESIVYHEMLHAALPPTRSRNGRRRVHTAEFRRRERLYARFEEAEAWLAENVARLARQRHGGSTRRR